MDAASLDRPEVEVEAIEELDDRDLERVLVGEARGRLDLGQAAEQAGETVLAIVLDGRKRQQLENSGLDLGVLLKADRVGRYGYDSRFIRRVTGSTFAPERMP